MKQFTVSLLVILLVFGFDAHAQWQPDLGDGTYKNPVIFADYSDPDVIRVGDDYWMVASSFTCMPGIPVLHSYDLINWTIVNHVYDGLPLDKYRHPAHGEGSWAPSIRYHKGMYYVYFCTPKDGLFVARSTNPRGKWDLHHIVDVEKWEDPCPLWDDDGQAYLVHSIHRGGPAIIHKMSPDGLRLLDNGVTVYHNEEINPVLEGMKFCKRNGWYYIFAPAGGVETGWQTVLRSRNIYGPYEARKVLAEGNGINGPHQGGLVETQTGEWWFMHFQSRGFYGRVCHLQPARWTSDDWMVMGEDPDGDGVGAPVLTWTKPNVGKTYPICNPQTSDDFSSKTLGKQWQWQAMEQSDWYSLKARKGYMRLFASICPSEKGNLYYAGNLLLQKIAAPSTTMETYIEADFEKDGERAGLVVMGNAYTYIALVQTEKGKEVQVVSGKNDKYPVRLQVLASAPVSQDNIYLRVSIAENARCRYSYSLDGKHFISLGDDYPIVQGTWIGAKYGIFSSSPNVVQAGGYADFDYVKLCDNGEL